MPLLWRFSSHKSCWCCALAHGLNTAATLGVHKSQDDLWHWLGKCLADWLPGSLHCHTCCTVTWKRPRTREIWNPWSFSIKYLFQEVHSTENRFFIRPENTLQACFNTSAQKFYSLAVKGLRTLTRANLTCWWCYSALVATALQSMNSLPLDTHLNICTTTVKQNPNHCSGQTKWI